MTLEYGAVDGDSVSWFYADVIAWDHLIDRRFDIATIANDDRSFGAKVHQGPNRVGRTTTGPAFEYAPEQDEGDDGRRGFVVEVRRVAAAGEQVPAAEQPAGAGAEHDQQVHIGRAIAQRLADAGARVGVVDIDPATAESAATAIGPVAIPIQADVSRSDDVSRMVAALLAIESLIAAPPEPACDVVLLATVDEEYLKRGVEAAVSRKRDFKIRGYLDQLNNSLSTSVP